MDQLPHPGNATDCEDGPSVPTRARWLHPQDIGLEELRSWLALEAQAVTANAYMSPHFVLPALRHLDPSGNAHIVLVDGGGTAGGQVIAAAAVRPMAATSQLPLPHNAIYQSRHSYLGIPLLHSRFASAAAHGLFDALSRSRKNSAGLLLPNVDPLSPFFAVLRRAWRERGLPVFAADERRRAILVPARSGDDAIREHLGKQLGGLERRKRRLADQGEVRYLIRRSDVDDAVIDSFLRLEHCGWKGKLGTSLRSNPGDEAFFREMAGAFAREGRALFTELRLNADTIASTSNFVSAGAGFAFKVGWDEAYRKYGVGVLSEVELARHAPADCADLAYVDSGSMPGSYVESLWPDRRILVTAFLPFSGVGQLAWRTVDRLRGLAQFVKARRRRVSAPADGVARSADLAE
jgi:Acetyltransferase (GNAT) domain